MYITIERIKALYARIVTSASVVLSPVDRDLF